MTKFKMLVVAALALTLCASSVVANAQDAPKKAKNVIVFLGDGNGFNSEALGTWYHHGEGLGAESYQKFPVVMASAPFMLHKHSDGTVEWDPVKDPEKNMGYVPKEFWKDMDGAKWRPTNTETTDSGASATAFNTGVKTLNSYICMDPQGNKLENFADLNYKAGRSVGIVSTDQISHATPAASSAHNINRGHYEEISKEQINELPLTVLMGSGHPYYDNGKKRDKDPDKLDYKFVGGREVWDAVSKNEGYKGWTFIDDRPQFAELAAATPDKKAELPKKLLGICRTTGDVPAIDGCIEDPNFTAEHYGQEAVDHLPTLAEMTLATLNILSQNENGFYAMIEGGNIDHANHANNAPKSCREHVAFANAIDAAIDWIEKYSSWDETLVIVTADHETGQIWGEGTYDDVDGNGKWSKEDEFLGFQPVPKTEKGKYPAVQYGSGSHTNALVPCYIKGAGAEYAKEFVRGNDAKAGEFWGFSGDFIFNSDIFNIMMKASGISR